MNMLAEALNCVRLSPAQGEFVERVVGDYPATNFDAVEWDRFSCAIVVECEDAGAVRTIVVTANGKVMPA